MRALGCVKFTSEAIEKVPDLFERIAALPSPSGSTKKCTHWAGLDRSIFKILEHEGLSACQHSIRVGHLHRGIKVPYKGYIRAFIGKNEV